MSQSNNNSDLTPHMTFKEASLLKGFLDCSQRYTEFGCGGSTVVAASAVSEWIISTDSSREWLKRVSAACRDLPLQPELVLADIGTTGDWGMPANGDARDRWPAYHETIWEDPRSKDADLFMVDGRFRVASFIQILKRCKRDSVILIHDFASRQHYHVIKEVAQEIARADELSAFLPKPVPSNVLLDLLLDIHRYDPA